jgi:hypothetical protein
MSPFVPPVVRATDANNLALSGAKWYFYITDTTTPAAVYTTSALDVPHANPVIADSGGLFAPIYLSRSVIYRAVLKTAAGAPIADIDPISDPLADLFAGGGSSLVGFLQSGAGAVSRTVQDRLRDTVSIKDFGAVGDGVTDDRAAIAAAVAGARGRRIVFPKGNYLINTDGGTITLEEVELVGEDVLDGAPTSIDEGANAVDLRNDQRRSRCAAAPMSMRWAFTIPTKPTLPRLRSIPRPLFSTSPTVRSSSSISSA